MNINCVFSCSSILICLSVFSAFPNSHYFSTFGLVGFDPLAIGVRLPCIACVVLYLAIAPPVAGAGPERRASAESVGESGPCCSIVAAKSGFSTMNVTGQELATSFHEIEELA